MPGRIEPTPEEEATFLYQSLWNNRERGQQLHAELEDLVDMCDTQEDQNLAMGIKHYPMPHYIRGHSHKNASDKKIYQSRHKGVHDSTTIIQRPRLETDR